MIRAGIDLGGSKIEIAAFAPTGATLLRQRIPTPQGDYPATLSAIAALVQEAEHTLGQTVSVGIGHPGAEIPQTGRIKNANSTCLNGQPLRHDLQTRLQREIRLANDANCLALSEAVDGAAAGAGCTFGVILGTGVGGGIVINGQVITGANAIAGEWGHNPLPLPAGDDLPLPACYCGRAGCIETYLSGPGMAADHLRHTGQPLTPPAIVAGAATGHSACEATLCRYEQRLARALAQVVNILDPDVIVLGGGLSNLARLYQNVPRYWSAWIFSPQVATRLVANQHGDSSGVRGAAWLWPLPAGKPPVSSQRAGAMT